MCVPHWRRYAMHANRRMRWSAYRLGIAVVGRCIPRALVMGITAALASS